MNRCCVCGRKIENSETKYGLEFCKTCGRYEKQLAELKAENERLEKENINLKAGMMWSKALSNVNVNKLNEISKSVDKLEQQLKEKDDEIAKLKEGCKSAVQSFNRMETLYKLKCDQLKLNTKQVCEKIRERLRNIENDGECKINIGINTLIDFDVICEILDQIEKGE